MPQNLLKKLFWKINLFKMMKIFGCALWSCFLNTPLSLKKSLYINMKFFKIVLFMNFKTHSSSAIAIYELHILILRLRPISLSVLHKWNMSRKMTSVVCTNTFICMLWRKRRRKNVKRPDSPDVDREGGRPT